MKNRYRNPCHRPGANQYGPEFYENDCKPYLEYRGYTVFKLWDKAFDVVKDGICITQRCGASKELIDRIEAGEDMYTPKPEAKAA